MSLTTASGPLAPEPAPSNYSIDGPKHRIAFTDFPRRLRAEIGGETVIDTRAAKLLHETAILARLYVPLADVRADLLRPSDTASHCPFKGDATYRSIAVGDQVSEDALWVYEDPNSETPWLKGYAGVYEDRFDRWLDEDEEISGHVRDPFHRVDARASSRHVRVTGPGGEVLAESEHPLVVSETGIPNRFYIPRSDVRAELERSEKDQTVCPYKGWATYWSAPGAPDIAWSYDEPLDGVAALAGHVSFDGEGIAVEEVA
jgi:uncharacterized protein (DUF427 family)